MTKIGNCSKAVSTALLASALGFGLAVVPHSSDETVRLNLSEGDEVRYKMSSTTTTEVDGQSFDVVVKSVTLTEVLERDGDWFHARTTTEEMEVESGVPIGAADAPDYTGLAFTFELNDRGQIRNMVLVDAASLDPMARQMIESGMRSANVAGFMGVNFPEGPVNVGSKWDVKIDASKLFEGAEMMGEVEGVMPVEFVVAGFEDLKGVRHMKLDITMDADLTMMMQGLEAETTMSMTGEYWIDLSSGLMTKAETVMINEMDIGVAMMTQEGTSTFERVD